MVMTLSLLGFLILQILNPLFLLVFSSVFRLLHKQDEDGHVKESGRGNQPERRPGPPLLEATEGSGQLILLMVFFNKQDFFFLNSFFFVFLLVY